MGISSKIIAFIFLFPGLLVLFTANSQPVSDIHPKVGLVLSGGGAKGFAHIGALMALEEHNIPIDFIGGSSMGAIVGGLYAIGYDAQWLEEFAKKQDWDQVLYDHIPRNILSMEEKERNNKYVVSLPIKNKRIILPSGIVSGQNASKLLTHLTRHVHQIKDFTQFEIPFVCVATNIVTGEPVVFNSGFLPEALRASMAIPTMFHPIEIDEMLLVDGGLVHNLPVEQVRDLGADIIISVDVQDPYYRKEEINSFVEIMEQAGKFLRERNYEYSLNSSDIVIQPPVSREYSIYSFNHADSLIAIGYFETKKNITEIRRLLSENGIPLVRKEKNKVNNLHVPDKKDSIVIQEIRIEGRKNVSRDLIRGKIKIFPPEKISPERILNAVDRVYGSHYFERVTFKLKPMMNGFRLKLIVKEIEHQTIRAGIHYDDDNKAGILLNTNFKNLIQMGSDLSINLKLSERPEFSASYFHDRGWKPGLHAALQTINYEVTEFESNRQVAKYGYSEVNVSLGARSTLKSSYSLEGGIQGEISSIRSHVSPIEFNNIDNRFLNIYALLKMDTYNDAWFPSKGFQFFVTGKYVFDYESLLNINGSKPFSFLKVDYNQVIPLSRKLVLSTRVNVGTTVGDSIPNPYYFYMGGAGQNYKKGAIRFVGLKTMQKYDLNAIIGAAELRYEFVHNHFFTLIYNLGSVFPTYHNLTYLHDYISGIGIRYGYKSVIGPVELTLSASTANKMIQPYLNVGFWF